jgi:hypothetical protein
LSPRFTNTCVVRVFGPAAAKLTAPRVLWAATGSSGIVARSHAVETVGYGLIPNWTTKFGTTRKNSTPSKKCAFARS